MTNNNFNPNIKQINGPTNIVRMEGRVHGIKKIIYLFMDWHIPLHEQSECNNLFSKDIDKYLIENFYEISKKSSAMYDFFMEIRPTEELVEYQPTDSKNRRKDMYIRQVMKLFRKIFKYDKEKNKVDVPELFSNIRLHYLDIRDYLYIHYSYKLRDISYILNQISFIGDLNLGAIEDIISIYTTIEAQLQFISDALKSKEYIKPAEKPRIIKKKGLEEIDEEMIKALSYKIRNRYNDEEIKNILNKNLDFFIDNNLTPLIGKINNAIDILKKYTTSLPPNFSHLLTRDERLPGIYTYGPSEFLLRDIFMELINITSYIYLETTTTFARITDIYLLRRFLDKDYITNAIVFTGALHSETYIYILVRDFEFDITHVSYSAIKDLNELKKEIKKVPIEELSRLFSPLELYQCSDITHFPDNFL